MDDTHKSGTEAEERWIHDMRNVVNVLASGVTLALRLLDKGRTNAAREVLLVSELAMGRCYALLNEPHLGEHVDALPADLEKRAAAEVACGNCQPRIWIDCRSMPT